MQNYETKLLNIRTPNYNYVNLKNVFQILREAGIEHELLFQNKIKQMHIMIVTS
jgi:hypothetical protein